MSTISAIIDLGDSMPKKIILVDGNNLIFRSYYATAYTGSVMKNSKGFPTNALYGFVNMINKIIETEKPTYMAVAFDVGKNFREEKYKNYKEKRIETPGDLKQQMPLARDILAAMGIAHFEMEPFEADDIIGTFVRLAELDEDFDATIVSSDKDLLQLINFETDVKLLKQKDHIRYDTETFIKDFGIEPIRIIDLKALAGDTSDNIPGVKGVGEKTALTLLQQYDSLEGIYEHIDEIKGKLQEKLILDKENAFLSKELATIYKEVPLDVDLESIKINPIDSEKLIKIYEELEFYSLIKNMPEAKTSKDEIKYKTITNINEINISTPFAFYIECDNPNYHKADILGMSICTNKETLFVPKDLVVSVLNKLGSFEKYTFDLKKNIILLRKLGLELNNVAFDTMIAAYLLNYNCTDDIAYLMKPKKIILPFYEEMLKAKFADEKILKESIVLKSRFIFDSKDEFVKSLEQEDMNNLFKDIEMPLISVLADMEYIGVKVNKKVLTQMKEETKIKIEMLEHEIYNNAGESFNINSPKQLGEILFGKLNLPGAKKTKTGAFKTDYKVLHKLIDAHPIIPRILNYRNLAKLYTTYLEGLPNYIFPNGKIHTIYKQNLTRTGRLSSTEPNMQNIPVRDEEGRKIRKAFIPESGYIFMSADYSQIEIRILAHISNSKDLINAMHSDFDIHTKVAMDIFEVSELAVTSTQRKAAKAVIFGIVYGISGFGLGENLEISPADAKKFIDKYLTLYPDVKRYMDEIVEVAKKEGCVRTLWGRKRDIDELFNTNYMIRSAGERIALNTPIQGSSADIIKKAMNEIHNAIKKDNLKSRMLLQVHDELIFEVEKSEIEKMTALVKNIMESTCELKVPLKVDIEYGSNWYEAK